jgi:glycosyltransferase involved in cell wall biosynthesis
MNNINRRIIIFTTDFSHELVARVHHVFNYLKKKSIPLILINFDFTYYPSSIQEYIRRVTKTLSFALENRNFDQIIINLPSLPYSFRGRIRTFSNAISFILQIFLSKIVCRRLNKGIIVGFGPVACFAAFLTFQEKCPIIYEDTDFWPGLCKGAFHKILISYIERYCLKKATAVISNSRMLEKRAKFYNSTVYWIPNGVSIKLFHIKRKQKTSPPTLVYIGSLQKWAGLQLVVRSLGKLLQHYPNLVFKLSGVGPEKDILEIEAARCGVRDHIIFLGKLPYYELASLLAESSIGIATFISNEFNFYATPLKVLEYMAAGLPIIATNWGETARIIKESKSGVLVKWDPIEFKDAVIKLLENTDLWRECSRNGIKWIASYDWHVILDRWLEIVLLQMK